MSTKAQPKQKRDLQQLLMSERRWRLLVEYNNDAITMVAKDGTILYENPALNVMSGYSPEELIGQNVFSLLHLDDQETVAHSFQEIISHPGRKIITQVRFTRKDGTCCWVEATNINCLDDPDLGAIVTYYRDITQRKEDEEALRKNEKQLQALVTSLDDIVFEVDDSGIYLNVWTANEDMLFQPRGNSVGRRFDEVFGEEASRPFFRLLRLCLESGIPQNLEYPVYLPGGERWFNARCTPIHYTNQTSKTVSILVRDVTQQKQAEELLKESEKMFRELFDNLPMQSSIYKLIRDEHGETVDWEISKINPLGAASLGVDANAVIGQSALSLFGEAIMEPYLEICRQILISGKPRIFETHFEMNEHDYLSSAFLIGGEYYATISIDITDRKLTDKKLRESQSRSQAMLNAIPDLMFRLNRKGLILDYKADITDLYSQTDETIIGKRIRDISPPEFADLIDQKIQETLISDALQTFEYNLPIPNTGIQYYEARMTSSGPDEVIAIVRNITKRKQAELAMIQKIKLQEQLEHTAAIVPGLIHIFKRDVHGNFSMPYASPAIEEVYGISAEDVAKDMSLVFERIVSEDVLLLISTITESADTMTPWREEFRYTHPQKGLRWFSGHSTPVRDIDGCILWYGIIQDITDSKQTEIKQQQLIERLDLATRSAQMGIWDWDIQKNEIVWDDQMYALYGLKPNEFEGAYEAWLHGVHPEDRESSNEVSAAAVRGECEYDTEFRVLWPDGSVHWLKANGLVYRDKNGTPLRMVGINYDITVGKQTEEALIQNEEKFRLLAESIGEVFWIFDNHLQKILYISPAYEKIWGRTAESLYENGQEYIDAIIPEDRHVVIDALEKQALGAETQMEYRIARLDGSIRWIFDRSFPVYDGTGAVVRTTGIATDITERKRHESLIYVQRDLARAVGRYETIFDGFSFFLQALLDVSGMDSGGLYLFDEEYKNIELINQQGLGENFVSMLDRFTINSPFVKTILVGEPIYFSSDHPIVRNAMHQAEGLMCMACIPIFYQEHVVGCMNLASHTLAETPNFARYVFETLSVEIGNFVIYLRNEHALRNSEEKFRKLTEELEQRVKEQTSEVFAVHERLELATQAAELGTWDWNVRTNQLLWDNQMYKISRVDKDSFTGNIDFSMRRIHLEDVEIVKQKMQELLNGSSVYGQLEYRLLRGDGSIGYLKTHAVVQCDANHQVERIIGMVQDVTHEKHAESALRESNDRLSIANLKLETAMQVKDEFLASMSHELRTPLTGILGLSEALQFNTYGQLTDKQKNTLKIIENSGNHLLALINDILDLSKIQSGKLEIHTSPSLLEDICQASLQLTKGMASQKRQVIRYSSPAMPIFLDVDTRRIKQVIVNLLSNAIKFTPERGELGLNIEADKLDRQVRIIVWDKGIGIKPEHLSKLFLPFTQIDSSLAREYSGTGLGLSLVKRLVELHEGTVTVESVFGEGTRFIVSLPWITESPVSPSQDVPTSQPDTITENTSAQLIMITDDNLLLLDMLADFLESQKYRTAKVNSGSEFFEKITEIRPDLILMDIQMPGIDGLEVIRYLRKHQDPSIASIPVIAVTALAMTGDREKCLAAGANDYMSKPVALMELKQSIQNLIG